MGWLRRETANERFRRQLAGKERRRGFFEKINGMAGEPPIRTTKDAVLYALGTLTGLAIAVTIQRLIQHFF